MVMEESTETTGFYLNGWYPDFALLPNFQKAMIYNRKYSDIASHVVTQTSEKELSIL